MSVTVLGVLGLELNLATDDLKLGRRFTGEENSVFTHRVVYSVTSSVFDPFRLALPTAITIRLVLGLIWPKALKSCNEEILGDISKQYLEWLQEVPALKELSIN